MLPPDESVESLALKTIGQESVVVVVAAGHSLAADGPVEPEALKEATWVAMNRPRSILEAFRALVGEQGIGVPNVAVETSSLDFLKSMVRDSGMLAAIPRGAVFAELENGSFTALQLGALPSVEIGFVHRHGLMSPLVTQIVYQLEALLRSNN